VRKLTVSLKRIAGAVNEFHAWVNGRKVITSSDPDEEPEWTGDVPDDQVRVKVKVYGIGSARYELGIDLPGTANDQSLQLGLDGGYHETTLQI
jgi:hypothetical protein